MKAQEISRALQLRDWANQVSVQKQSGLNIKDWHETRGINRKTFYYRRRKLREELAGFIESDDDPTWLPTNKERASAKAPVPPPKPVFAALPMPNSKAALITVRINDYAVDIQQGADEILVERVLQTVAKL